MEHTVGGARISRPAVRARGVNGTLHQPPPVRLYVVCEQELAPAWSLARWARWARLLGRATAWSVPGLAAAVLIGSGRPGTASTVAAVLAPLTLLALAALLAGGRGMVIGSLGAVAGGTGTAILLLNSGGVFAGHHPSRPALAGACLLAAGWVVLAIAGLYGRAVGAGDAVLLTLSAAPLALGGIMADTVPRLAAMLLLAAGIGLCRTVLDPRWPLAPGRAAE